MAAKMNLFAMIGLAVVSTVICILLRQYKPEYAMVVSLACGVLLFSMVLVNLVPAFRSMADLMERAAINGEYTRAIVKTLGICYVTQLAADACRDAGQSAIASKVELAGKVAIVLISLPLFDNLVEIALGLINTQL